MYSGCVCRCIYVKTEEGRGRPAVKPGQLRDNLLLKRFPTPQRYDIHTHLDRISVFTKDKYLHLLGHKYLWNGMENEWRTRKKKTPVPFPRRIRGGHETEKLRGGGCLLRYLYSVFWLASGFLECVTLFNLYRGTPYPMTQPTATEWTVPSTSSEYVINVRSRSRISLSARLGPGSVKSLHLRWHSEGWCLHRPWNFSLWSALLAPTCLSPASKV